MIAKFLLLITFFLLLTGCSRVGLNVITHGALLFDRTGNIALNSTSNMTLSPNETSTIDLIGYSQFLRVKFTAPTTEPVRVVAYCQSGNHTLFSANPQSDIAILCGSQCCHKQIRVTNHGTNQIQVKIELGHEYININRISPK